MSLLFGRAAVDDLRGGSDGLLLLLLGHARQTGQVDAGFLEETVEESVEALTRPGQRLVPHLGLVLALEERRQVEGRVAVQTIVGPPRAVDFERFDGTVAGRLTGVHARRIQVEHGLVGL